MLRIVLPTIARALAALAQRIYLISISTVNVVSIKIVVVVDIDVAVSPIAIAPMVTPPPGGAPCDTGSPCKAHSGIPPGIRVRVIRILRFAVNHRWIVRWNVNDLGIGILNDNGVFPAFAPRFHFLLRTGF